MSVIDPFTSCAMSLSPVEMRTGLPSFAARTASVPMMSSASTPSIAQDRQALRLDDCQQRLDLRPQVVRHRRTMRLVFGEQLVAERLSRRVEHHGDALRL